MRTWVRRVGEGLGKVLLAVPLAAGWAAGALVRCARLGWAALVEGFHMGNRL